MTAGGDLERRLLDFLQREHDTARRELDRLRALSIEDRVVEGDCIRAASFAGVDTDASWRFDCGENLSRFREGDPVLLSDGVRFEDGIEMEFVRHDPVGERLWLLPDRFARAVTDDPPAVASIWCIDRRTLSLSGELVRVVQAACAEPQVGPVAALSGRIKPEFHADRRSKAVPLGRRLGLDESQVQAYADGVATDTFCLIQGPPGTGKTRVAAEILRTLVRAHGCRVAVTAYTHRAVNNVLLAVRKLDPSVFCAKIGDGRNAEELRRAGVEMLRDARRLRLPDKGGMVVGGTAFGLAKIPVEQKFHFTLFDEAGQIPLPHAFPGMSLARRWILLGDHQQLQPVVQGDHADEAVTRSVFAHLHALHPARMLTVSYRMNRAICAFVGDAFYGGQLTSSPAAADRKLVLRPGGRFRELLDPDHPLVVGLVAHRGRLMRSPEEADLAARLVQELVLRHGLRMEEIAVVSPFRAQNGLIESLLRPHARLTLVDTVERIQGQEREVVIVSLTASDPDWLSRRADFFYSLNRINVAISRARSKCIVLGSRSVFRGRSMDVQHLRAMSLFSRIVREWHCVPVEAGVAAGLPVDQT
jgi:DNA replication ATP-dependent helicase Dna2